MDRYKDIDIFVYKQHFKNSHKPLKEHMLNMLFLKEIYKIIKKKKI